MLHTDSASYAIREEEEAERAITLQRPSSSPLDPKWIDNLSL